MKNYFVMLCVFGIIGCSESTKPTPDPFDADHSNIVNPKERWQAYGTSDVVLTQSRICECISVGPWHLTIDDKLITGVIDSATNRTLPKSEWPTNIKTIEDLFLMADRASYTTRPYILRVTYDPRYGIPTEIYVDYDEIMADDEMHTITRLKR